MERYNLRCRLSGLAEETFGNGVFWRKNKHPAFLRKFSFAVTPPRGLGDGIETGECPIDDRKVNIHPRLNELGGNHPAGQSGFEAVDVTITEAMPNSLRGRLAAAERGVA